MYVKKADEIPAEIVGAGHGTKRQVLIGDDIGPHFQMRRFIMQPGGGMPRHTNTVEHQQYVLSGRAEIGVGRDKYEVGPGAVVFIPAGAPHWYQALEGEPFVFLCLVPNLPDRIELTPEEPA